MPVITFASQKGGVGKSTLLCNIATCLYYNLDVDIRILDTDIPQNSIADLRKTEEAILKNAVKLYKETGTAEFFLKKVLKKPKKIYPIEIIDVLDVEDKFKNFNEEYILVDSIGTTNTHGYDEFFSFTDFLVIPISIDFFEYKSTRKYIQEIVLPAFKDHNLKNYFVLLNKVDLRAPEDLKDMISMLEGDGINCLENYIPLGKTYKSEPILNQKSYNKGIRSTMMPSNNIYLNRVTEELYNKIRNHGK